MGDKQALQIFEGPTHSRRSKTQSFMIRVSTVCFQNIHVLHVNVYKFNKMKSTTQQPLKRKWAGPIDGKIPFGLNELNLYKLAQVSYFVRFQKL